MKKFYVIMIPLFLALVSCNSGSNVNSEREITTDIVHNPVTASGEYSTDELPEIKFEKKVHDFGIMIQGEKVAYTFKYTNTGRSDLIIKSAKGSCGCTVPSYSKKPIQPGKSGEVEVVFNTAGRKGNQRKTITLYTNAQPNKEVLTITGQIVVPN